MIVGNVIKKAREKKGISQADLAKKIGVGRACLCNIESGRTYPSYRSLLIISREVGIDLNSLAKKEKIKSKG